MTVPAATKITKLIERRAKSACASTQLRMADLLRIGLYRVLAEFDATGSILASPNVRITSVEDIAKDRSMGRARKGASTDAKRQNGNAKKVPAKRNKSN